MRIYSKEELPQHLEDGTANPDWLAIRAGKFTASDFHQYLGINGKGLSDTAQTNLYKKVLESLGFDIGGGVSSSAMERGTDLEPEAREAYMAETFEDVREVGFVDYEKLRAGCSPDGVIYGEDGQIEKIIEIKCPEIVMFVRNSDGYISPQYRTQMQYNMLITGAKQCDFVAYYPGMRLVVQPVEADAKYQGEILQALANLNAKFDEIEAKIKAIKEN